MMLKLTGGTAGEVASLASAAEITPLYEDDNDIPLYESAEGQRYLSPSLLLVVAIAVGAIRLVLSTILLKVKLKASGVSKRRLSIKHRGGLRTRLCLL